MGAQQMGAQQMGAQQMGAQQMGAQQMGAQQMGAQQMSFIDNTMPNAVYQPTHQLRAYPTPQSRITQPSPPSSRTQDTIFRIFYTTKIIKERREKITSYKNTKQINAEHIQSKTVKPLSFDDILKQRDDDLNDILKYQDQAWSKTYPNAKWVNNDKTPIYYNQTEDVVSRLYDITSADTTIYVDNNEMSTPEDKKLFKFENDFNTNTNVDGMLNPEDKKLFKFENDFNTNVDGMSTPEDKKLFKFENDFNNNVDSKLKPEDKKLFHFENDFVDLRKNEDKIETKSFNFSGLMKPSHAMRKFERQHKVPDCHSPDCSNKYVDLKTINEGDLRIAKALRVFSLTPNEKSPQVQLFKEYVETINEFSKNDSTYAIDELDQLLKELEDTQCKQD
jgi:hypothetical protein